MYPVHIHLTFYGFDSRLHRHIDTSTLDTSTHYTASISKRTGSRTLGCEVDQSALEVLKLRMSEAIRLLPVEAFMAYRRTTIS